jgi:hypothetical protein
MKVRYACSIDVPALAELGKRAHAETRFSVYDYSMTRITENLHHLIEIGQNERGTNCLLIAEDDGGNIAGVLIGVVERHIFSDLPVASVMVYYVFPKKRMSGAGFKLICAFRRWAENRSAFEICVGVTSGSDIHRSDRLLTRIGFERTGANYSLQGWARRRCQQAVPQAEMVRPLEQAAQLVGDAATASATVNLGVDRMVAAPGLDVAPGQTGPDRTSVSNDKP